MSSLKTKNTLQEILTLCDKTAKVRLQENNIFNDDRSKEELLLFIQEIVPHLERRIETGEQWRDTAHKWQKL